MVNTGEKVGDSLSAFCQRSAMPLLRRLRYALAAHSKWVAPARFFGRHFRLTTPVLRAHLKNYAIPVFDRWLIKLIVR
jgi:hypothetical protein